MAACTREPTADEINDFTDLAGVATWAKLKGDPLDLDSQSGSLFFLVGALEDGELCSIADFAALDPVAFQEKIVSWTHKDDDGNTVMPGLVTTGKARSCLRACRIALDIDWTRERTTEWQKEQDALSEAAYNTWTAPQSSTAQPSDHDPVTTAINTLIAQRADEIKKAKTDHVNLGQTVDTTKSREVPLISTEEYNA